MSAPREPEYHQMTAEEAEAIENEEARNYLLAEAWLPWLLAWSPEGERIN